MEALHFFLNAIADDPRIAAAHISVYMALWKKWMDKEGAEPVCFFRTDLLSICKISGPNTYHKIIRQLHEYGYINYVPSYNHFVGSLVYFTGRDKIK